MSEPKVFVSCRNAPKKVDPRTVRRRLTRILVHLGLKNAEVSCVLCNDPFIQILNQTYRKKNKPTDVLSFSMNEGELPTGACELLGDIVVSVETAIRQAKDLDHSVLEEVTSLVIHGVLHLLGYDHITRNDEKEMTAKARELEGLFPQIGNRS